MILTGIRSPCLTETPLGSLFKGKYPSQPEAYSIKHAPMSFFTSLTYAITISSGDRSSLSDPSDTLPRTVMH